MLPAVIRLTKSTLDSLCFKVIKPANTVQHRFIDCPVCYQDVILANVRYFRLPITLLSRNNLATDTPWVDLKWLMGITICQMPLDYQRSRECSYITLGGIGAMSLHVLFLKANWLWQPKYSIKTWIDTQLRYGYRNIVPFTFISH